MARFNSREMRRLDRATGTKQLWQCVKNLTKPGESVEQWGNITAAELNSYYFGTDSQKTSASLQILLTHLLISSILRSHSPLLHFTHESRLKTELFKISYPGS